MDDWWPLNAGTLAKAIAKATTNLQKALLGDWRGYPIFRVVGGSGLSALEEGIWDKSGRGPMQQDRGVSS